MQRLSRKSIVYFTTIGLLIALGRPCPAANRTIAVQNPASPRQSLAAKEVRRYVYLRTGELMRTGNVAKNATISFTTDPDLQPEQYHLNSNGKTLTISGGSDLALLYGAYAFAEKLGVRFYLHGDVVPDKQIPFVLPVLDETRKPLFATRGIQPFHDFPEGPDWWNQDDYLAYVGQLAKMKMNFLGLHTYPQGGVGPEPLVWIGLPQDVNPDGTVTFSYPSQWHNTARPGMWGYAAMKTSDFTDGASQLFPTDTYGPDVMAACMPSPKSPRQNNELFNRVGKQMGTVFTEARKLGVKTCVGTETPLTIPNAVREHLKQLGKDPADPKVVKELYAGMVKRIQLAMPADYYWLWTPEGWTWGGNNPAQFEATKRDIQAALNALNDAGKPMQFATSGWVLGPQHDRSALDSMLPKECAMSCINRNVGHDGVEPAFANITGRPKWAIPWMENDPNLVACQPWASRMRYDAVDAKRFGCTGLLGIHWRTKILSGNVSALAQAAWDQSYVPAGFNTTPVKPSDMGPGGIVATTGAAITGADVPEVYQSVRYNLNGYPLTIPNGTYTVTLKFTEITYDQPGKRVFGVKVQGNTLAEKLDLVSVAGKFKAYDLKAEGVKVTDGTLKIEFPRVVEYPCISGIVIEGMTDAANQLAAAPLTRKINCGGGSVAGYEADITGGGAAAPSRRTMPIADFYVDFAKAHFGEDIAAEAGKILTELDGQGFQPNAADWHTGPGDLNTGSGYHAQAQAKGVLVEQFAALRPRVVGAGNLQRFDYWMNTLRASIAMYEGAGIRGDLQTAITLAKAEKDATKRMDLTKTALALRRDLARSWDLIMELEVAAADTPGELGTIANLEQHSRTHAKWLTGLDGELTKLLAQPLPMECAPAMVHKGPTKLTVLTIRSSVTKGETLTLPIIALDKQPMKSVCVRVRPLGGRWWKTIPAEHIGRAVYRAKLPAAQDDFEYQVLAKTAAGTSCVWPATAPALNQTVVVQ